MMRGPWKHGRFQNDRKPLQREQAGAQHNLPALQQALVDVGLVVMVAEGVQW
jgi:hypothetical protein